MKAIFDYCHLGQEWKDPTLAPSNGAVYLAQVVYSIQKPCSLFLNVIDLTHGKTQLENSKSQPLWVAVYFLSIRTVK